MEWRSVWNLWVDGEPKAQPRPRFAKRGRHSSTYMPTSADAWKTRIADTFFQAGARAPRCGDGPLRLEMDVYFARPQYMKAKRWPDGRIPHVTKPDWDNVGKAVCDALVTWDLGPMKVSATPDDARFAQAEVRKWWCAKGGKSGAQIRILILGKEVEPEPVAQQMTPAEALALIRARKAL
jgi:Holliday junction resolvase RusA-like endonuclease